MQLPPAEVLLSWPTPNYKDPVTRGHELEILTFVLFPIAMFMISLRTFTRLHLTKAWGIDDILLLCAVPPTLAIAISTIVAVRGWGWDRHIWDVEFDQISKGLRLLVALLCLFAMAVCFYKLSILILTKRIMTAGTGVLRHVATAGMVFVVLEGVIFCIVAINTCSPVSAYWTLSFKPQHCINEKVHLLIGGIINTSTDFLVFALPLPTVLQLKMPRRQQVILGLLFGAGFTVCVAGATRIFYTWKATSSYDRTWESYGLWICAILELYIGLICASIPGCKPFFSRYLPGLIGSTSLRSRGTIRHTTTTEDKGTDSGIPSELLSSRSGTIDPSKFSFVDEGTDLQDLGKMENTITYARPVSDDQFPHAAPPHKHEAAQSPRFPRQTTLKPEPDAEPASVAKQTPSSRLTPPPTWLETPSDSGSEDFPWEGASNRSSQELREAAAGGRGRGRGGSTDSRRSAAGFHGSQAAADRDEENKRRRRRSNTPRSRFSSIVGLEGEQTVRGAEMRRGSPI